MAAEADAIVVGSGINGLVAAAELARAGWSVVVVERNPEIGGFIATEERTLPGYRHDTYSSWHPLFVTGAAYASLGAALHEHGLRYRNTDGWITASVADDGHVTLAHRDPEQTAATFAHAADRSAYLAMLNRLAADMAPIGGLMSSEVRSWALLRHAVGLLRTAGRRGAERWLRAAVTSGRAYCRSEFHGSEVDHLWTPWLLHAGLSPDHASGGLMVPLLAGTLHSAGLPAVAGGSGLFATAFRSLLDSLGVRLETDTEVERILVDRGRATGVVADGRTLLARRAVLASVTPTALYGDLLPRDAVPPELHQQSIRFRYGRGEMQVHVALSEPLEWHDSRLRETPLLHLSDGSASTGIACAEAEAGFLPRRPTVVVGQQYVLDPSRVPEGAAALWLQLQEVPFQPLGDAAGELDTGQGWTPELAESFSHRVLDRVARHAPDVHSKVRAVDVVTPHDLAAYNPNAVRGDPYGGSAELDQNYLWRPLPGAGRHATCVRGLWHIGASTHPGPGLAGGSGHLVATALTRRRIPSRRG
ncbi:NAD(P)/FAD-dependent oxidoreductase [Saccharopolyspora sp. K220]|uniref:phytoene desaturase family protein n=1 Tax=Saccharopolyspora soli TaxID=2926618 RepID=UPI001F5847C5|nr:NAD(P)/FAD-dependent oxidoreductase [Saccharopolyspora soli]MCI2421995.1 NAD(P)/FAD-dependent oxidoreductase [Saccharopolyspora soli]